MHLPKKEKEIIVRYLKDKIKLKFIYIFGSFAKGEGRNDSDMDTVFATQTVGNREELYCKDEILMLNLKMFLYQL